MKKKLNQWICTDPDTLQYGRQISEKVFEFRQFDVINNRELFEAGLDMDLRYLETKPVWKMDCWDKLTVDLTNYTDKDIKENITGFYNSLNELKNTYGEESNWIIAECIFENSL